MSEQKHRINRLIVELSVPSVLEAPDLQEEISRIFHHQITALINQGCSELVGPDQLFRLDTLELDLGTLEANLLEAQFVDKIQETLRTSLTDALAAALATQQHSPETLSSLVLFELFAKTGSLPWWADHNNSGILSEHLQQLLSKQPAAFHQHLTVLLRDENICQRIATHYNNSELEQICGLLLPVYQQSFFENISTLLAALEETLVGRTWSASKQRQRFWSNCLLLAAINDNDYLSHEAFIQTTLARFASELGIRLSDLINDIEKIVQTGVLSNSQQLKKLLEGMSHVHSSEVHSSNPLSQSPALTENKLITLLRRYPSGEGALAKVRDELLTLSRGFSADVQRNWLDTLAANNDQLSAELVLQLIEDSTTRHGLNSEQCAHLKNLLHSLPMDTTTTASNHGEDITEFTVTNAGLVILWPFINNFFSHVGLLENTTFKNFASRQRGVGLLQLLTTQEDILPEYLLALNKLLCGMELTHPFDFGAPPSNQEINECNKLLKAIIAQVPILNDMSPEGFRSSFLLRPGLLSRRDGGWVLSVERQSYDIVLEHFPWGWNWLKLPWMADPLQVEW